MNDALGAVGASFPQIQMLMDVFSVKGEQKSCVIESKVLKCNFGNSESCQEGKKERREEMKIK